MTLFGALPCTEADSEASKSEEQEAATRDRERMAATGAAQPSAYGRDGERMGAMATAAVAVAKAAQEACRALTDAATLWRRDKPAGR